MSQNVNIFIIYSIIVVIFYYPFNLLASPQINYIISGDRIDKALNNLTGDPYNGRELVRNPSKGNCLACHQLPIPEEAFHGTIGPPLNKVSQRLTEQQLRLRVTDMKNINPFSIMPGYYRDAAKIRRISPQYEGTTILTAQEVEDIVSYLVTLKTGEIETF